MPAVPPPHSADTPGGSLCCRRHDVGSGVVRMSLSGGLDAGSGPDLDRALRDAEADAAIIVVDLDQLAFADPAGAAALRAAGERAGRHGRRIVAVNGHPEVREALERVGVAGVLKVIAISSGAASGITAAHAPSESLA